MKHSKIATGVPTLQHMLVCLTARPMKLHMKHSICKGSTKTSTYARLSYSTPNLFIREAMATELIVGPNNAIQGVKTFFGMNFLAPSVVVTTGTFMNGTIWVGRKSMSAGRAGEGASVVSHLLTVTQLCRSS